MGRKVWSGLLIGIALGIFITGTLYTYVFNGEGAEGEGTEANESKENGEGQETSEQAPENERASEAEVEIEIEENHSMEELVYDLMVEGVITSKQQQQQIYEVLTYENIDPGPRKIPIYASTEEILEAITNP